MMLLSLHNYNKPQVTQTQSDIQLFMYSFILETVHTSGFKGENILKQCLLQGQYGKKQWTHLHITKLPSS